MYKAVFVFAVAICYVVANPDPKPGVAYAAPVVTAPGVVTAQSSQYFHRNFNGLVAPIVATAPLIAAPIVKAAPLVAAPIVKVAPLVEAPIAKSTPFVTSPVAKTERLVKSAPLVAAPLNPAPVVARTIVNSAPVVATNPARLVAAPGAYSSSYIYNPYFAAQYFAQPAPVFV